MEVMGSASHYNEARRLLDLVGKLEVVCNVHPGRHLSIEAADAMRQKMAEFGVTATFFEGVTADLTPIIGAAQVHATLALYKATQE